MIFIHLQEKKNVIFYLLFERRKEKTLICHPSFVAGERLRPSVLCLTAVERRYRAHKTRGGEMYQDGGGLEFSHTAISVVDVKRTL